MVRKEFTFKGKNMQELNELSIDQFADLCDSRIKRSLKKGVDKKIMKKVRIVKGNPKAKPIRTHRRDLIIIPEMVGIRFAIHRGNTFETLEVTEKMLGHYVGELVFTRKRLQHGKAGIGATKSSTAITAR